MEAWQRNFRAAAKGLSVMAESEPVIFDFLLALVSMAHRKPLAQVGKPQCILIKLTGAHESHTAHKSNY